MRKPRDGGTRAQGLGPPVGTGAAVGLFDGSWTKGGTSQAAKEEACDWDRGQEILLPFPFSYLPISHQGMSLAKPSQEPADERLRNASCRGLFPVRGSRAQKTRNESLDGQTAPGVDRILSPYPLIN